MTRHIAYIAANVESIRRGGSTRTATCLCGWTGPQRGTLELAVDDALIHESSDMQVTVKQQTSFMDFLTDLNVEDPRLADALRVVSYRCDGNENAEAAFLYVWQALMAKLT